MKKKYLIVSFITLTILCIITTPIVFQNDTFYTIKIGKYILTNGIDMLDHFSIHTLPYTYPHWLYDVLISLIYSLKGFTSLYIFNIFCFIILTFLIFYFINQNNKSKFISLIFTILSVLILSSYIATRAQVISYIVFILEYIFITNYLKKPNNLYLIGLFILSFILCNMHVAVWPFYFIIFLPYITEYIIIKLFKRKTIFKFIELEENKNIKYLIITMFLSIIPGFLTPIKDTPFTYLIYTMMGNSQSFIQEHLPPDIPKLIILISFSLIIILLSVINKIKAHQLFFVLGLSFMAFSSDRHIALYTIFIFPILADLFNQIFIKINIDIDNYTLKYLLSNIGIIIITIILLILTGLFIYFNKDEKYYSEEDYPIQATNFILNNLDYKNIKLLNEYNYGSFLLFYDIPVFIDSRADLYTKEFNHKQDIFQDYMDKDYNYIIKKYNITHIISQKDSNLYSFIKNHNYNIIYEDKYFIVCEVI